MMFSTSGGDAYDILTHRLRYHNSKTLRRIFELLCTLEEAQALIELPAMAGEISLKLDMDKGTVEAQLEGIRGRFEGTDKFYKN